MQLVHHHLIYQANVGRKDLGVDAEKILEKFLYDLLKEIDMNLLIKPEFKFSKQRALAGLLGIVTAHISFHYWVI